MNLKQILIKIAPFLFKLATRIWESLSKKQQATVTLSIKFANIIKNSISEPPDWVIGQIAALVGLPIETVRKALTGVSIAIGHPEFSPADVIKYYQGKVASDLTDIGYNALFDTLAKILTQHVSKEPIEWGDLALGVVKVGFEVLKEKGELR